MQGWELHRPSTRPSSKQYVDRCEPAALPAVAPLRVLDGFAGKGRRFRHGSWDFLCGFRRGLFAGRLADLGKRRRVAVFPGRFGLRNPPEVAGGVRSC